MIKAADLGIADARIRPLDPAVVDRVRRAVEILAGREEDATLVTRLIGLFQDPESNPLGGQLIFSSHDATLLGGTSDDRALGRDQIWFTEKVADGSTRLYPLSDLGPRKEEAIGRRYLSGRYGATPIVSHQEFAEAVLSSMPGRRG